MKHVTRLAAMISYSHRSVAPSTPTSIWWMVGSSNLVIFIVGLRSVNPIASGIQCITGWTVLSEQDITQKWPRSKLCCEIARSWTFEVETVCVFLCQSEITWPGYNKYVLVTVGNTKAATEIVVVRNSADVQLDAMGLHGRVRTMLTLQRGYASRSQWCRSQCWIRHNP